MSEDRQLWAHSPAPGTATWHSLADHLRGTAELARRFAEPFGGGELAYWLGALHDVGKASCAWQDGLRRAHQHDERVGIDHKALGARIAQERGLGAFALGIHGHHGGLVDVADYKRDLAKRLGTAPANVASAEAELPRLLPDLPADLSSAVPAAWRTDPLLSEMAMRLCYGALVDADGLDTHAHHHSLAAPRVRPDADVDHLHKRFEQRRTEMLAERPQSRIDGLRQQVYVDCLAGAEREPGMFRLAAPTGVGKTIASAGFALRHAALHKRRRVIVAVPFLTITEQNAAVYRNLLDDDLADEGAEPVVLEHHSQVDFDGGAIGRWGRQAAENWDAPMVVTTFVRLFESIFARKPSAMRRVHRLAGAVIVLDEIQALPHDMLVPVLDALRLLVKHFGTTVLLCSATQPEFWALSPFRDLDCVDLIPDVSGLAAELRRVSFEWRIDSDTAPTLADIADEAAEVVQTATDSAARAAMVVVNTTANARTVFERWRDTGHGLVAWHLSTRMCPNHRQRVLERVRRLLRAGEPVLLVSTQLIEAGVDVDFPIVFRAMAPADSLLQAAGRANREGRLGRGGRVVIFAAEDGGQPPAYRTLVGTALDHFGPRRADPDDHEALGAYYRGVYRALNLEDPTHVGQGIQHARRSWQFRTVTDGPVTDPATGHRDRRRAFRLIRDEGIPVVTPQGGDTEQECAEVAALIEQIRNAPVPDLRDLRRLQPYTTTLHPSALRNDPSVDALLWPVFDGQSVRPGVLVEWSGDYDPATGISLDPKPEEFLL